MRAFKLLTTGLVLAVVGLFFWQNLAIFETVIPFTLDLYIRENVSWSHQLYTLLLISGALGFFMGALLMLKPYFNVRRLLAQERQEREQAKPSTSAPPTEPPPPPEDEPGDESSGEKTEESQ